MEMCPRPPTTEPATRQETLSPRQRGLDPGVGRGAWFQVHACTWLLTRTVLLHGHHVGSLAPPALPTQAQLQGVNGSHTYLRMSFLLKNVQSCRENTWSVRVSRWCGPGSSFRRPSPGGGERPWTELGAEESPPPSLLRAPGTAVQWVQEPSPEAFGLAQGSECRRGRWEGAELGASDLRGQGGALWGHQGSGWETAQE